MVEIAKVQAGQKVLIHGGSGGVGSIAIQLAKYLGAKVASTTSTGNMEMVKKLGADEVIDYKKQEFEDVLTGYDVVLGTIDGVIEKSLKILRPNSRIISLVGPLDAAFASTKGLNFILKFVFKLMSLKINHLAKKIDAK